MCDQDHSEKELQELDASGLITRRQFGVLLGAGVIMRLPQTPNAVKVTESEVTIKTPDGMADAYFVHPATGTAPGVLVWPDIFGLRPAFRQMGKRLAESGYSVLVVNPFYRTKKAPTAEQGAATPIQGLMPLMQGVMNETTQTIDAKAFISWLDQQAPSPRTGRWGRKAIAWAARLPFARQPHPIASERLLHSMARSSSPICRTARIYRLRKQRRSFSSPSRRMTICSGLWIKPS